MAVREARPRRLRLRNRRKARDHGLRRGHDTEPRRRLRLSGWNLAGDRGLESRHCAGRWCRLRISGGGVERSHGFRLRRSRGPRCRLRLEPGKARHRTLLLRCRAVLGRRRRGWRESKSARLGLGRPHRGWCRAVLRRRRRGGREPKCARLGLGGRTGLGRRRGLRLHPSGGGRLQEPRLPGRGLGSRVEPGSRRRRSIRLYALWLARGTNPLRRGLRRAGSRQRLHGCRRAVLRNRRWPACLGPSRLYRCGRPVARGDLTTRVLTGRRLVPGSRLDGRTRCLLMRMRWPGARADKKAVRQAVLVGVDRPL